MITKLIMYLFSVIKGRKKIIFLIFFLLIIFTATFISLYSISQKRTIQNKAATSTLQPIDNITSNFVTVNKGEFYLENERFYPYGTNYFPSYYNIPNFQVLPQNGKQQNFLASPYYDQHLKLLEKELQDMQGLGLNTISIQAPPIENQNGLTNLWNFLSRAKNHNLLVNIYLRNCDPLVFDKNVWQYFDETSCLTQLKEMNLKNNKTIFSYQIAWEPTLGTFEEQQKNPVLQQAWTKWLIERYGSVDDAKKNWALINTSIENKVFQRFIYDYSSKQYNQIIQKIKKIDSNHLISARTPSWEIIPAAAREFDYVALESWNLPVTIDKGASLFSGNGFAVEYARMLSDNKPITFFEFGENTLRLDCLNMSKAFNLECYGNTALSTQQSQAFYYRVFYDTALKTKVNGLFNWMYVGKRPWKNAPWEDREITDYGLREVPPDNSGNILGNKKLAYDVVKEYQPKFVQNENKVLYNDEIVIDENTYPKIEDLYKDNAQKFSQKIIEGKYPRIKTVGTSTNSLTAPAVCIGNIPYNDHCPHQYLNAEFNYLEIQDNTGNWKQIKNDESIIVKPNSPISARISVKNIGQSSWLSKSETGKGVVQVRGSKKTPYSGDYFFIKTITGDVDPVESIVLEQFEINQGINQEQTVYIQMFVSWLYMFGEQVKVTLIPDCVMPAKPENLQIRRYGNDTTISWSKISQAITYAIRIDDIANGWISDENCLNKNSEDVCQNNVLNNYYKFRSLSGHKYNIWIHGRNACGDWGPSTSTSL